MRTIRHDIPSRDIRLSGWAEEFLNRQERGLTGNPAQSGFPFNTGMWTEHMDFRQREHAADGSAWWPYEQTGYYLDGALRCAYTQKSSDLLAKIRANLQHIIDHAEPNGRLRAGNIEDDSWPMVVVMRALFAEYDNTQSELLLAAIEKHYQYVYRSQDCFRLPQGAGFDIRSVLHIEHLCRLTELTGNPWYLEQAENVYEHFTQQAKEEINPHKRSLTADGMATGVLPGGHGVTYHEFLKLPALLYLSTGKDIYRRALERAYTMLAEHHELASGLSSSVEHLAGKGPHLAHELCNVIEFIWSCGWALLALGEARYADKMEKVLYNAGFSSVTDDFKAHQYYGAPNMPISSDASSVWNDHEGWGYQVKGNLCYRPGHGTECCSGNVHRMFPVFLNRMCMVENNAVSIVFYLPSTVDVHLGDNDTLRIVQETKYPFEHKVCLNIENAPDRELVLRLRIPGWSKSYTVVLNGQAVLRGKENGCFAELHRAFKSGDQITLSLESEPFVDDRGRGLAVNYGPLVFSLPVEAKLTRTTFDGVGKCSPDFPAYQLFPRAPDSWQYALPADLTPDDMELLASHAEGYPWDIGKSPLKIRVPARKVKNWHLESWTHIVNFPQLLELGEDVSVDLEPMGTTLLRMTEFPKVTKPSDIPGQDQIASNQALHGDAVNRAREG